MDSLKEAMYEVQDQSPVILQVLKNIESATPIGVRPDFWQKVWSEERMPPYFGNIVRDQGKFYHASGVEKVYLMGLLDWVCETYVDRELHEFGCGPGANLQGREMKVKGYDWAESACEEVRAKGFEAERFDMLNPHKVGMKGALLTVHSMEQLGKNFKPFLDFIVSEKPDICIHIEPIVEFYEDNLLDHLAAQYHRKRGYLEGFIKAIPGKMEYVSRPRFGGLMHEAYNVIVWRP